MQKVTLNNASHSSFYLKDNKLAGSVSLIDCTINELPIENGEHRFEIISKKA